MYPAMAFFMTRDQLTHIRTMVKQELEGTDLYLVDVEFKGDARNRIIWVYVESVEGGVSLDRCAKLNRNLGDALEQANIFKGSYRLNVSSPGVDKPLMDIRQYYTNRGRKCNVRYKVGADETSVKGTLKDVDDSYIIIDDGKAEQRINFDDIVETRILITM